MGEVEVEEGVAVGSGGEGREGRVGDTLVDGEVEGGGVGVVGEEAGEGVMVVEAEGEEGAVDEGEGFEGVGIK